MATSGQDRIGRRQVVRGATATAAVMPGTPSVHAQKDRQILLELNWSKESKTGHMLLATAARLAKARETRKNSCRFAVHSENPGYVYCLY